MLSFILKYYLLYEIADLSHFLVFFLQIDLVGIMTKIFLYFSKWGLTNVNIGESQYYELHYLYVEMSI